MTEQFPGNSKRAKSEQPEPKVIKQVVQSEVTLRKKSLGKRFKETFVGGETQGVGSYLFFDVLIPAARDTIVDVTTQGVERLMFGESTSRNRRSRGSYRGGSNSRVAYNRMSGPLGRAGMADEPRHTMSSRARSTHDFSEVIIPHIAEANEVVSTMFDTLELYEEVTVADFYAMVGETAAFTDEKWGWLDLRGTNVRRTRGGYVINLPPPQPLD